MTMLKKFLKNIKGVTFIELMVVITIMAILSIAFYIGSASSSTKDEIILLTDQLTTDFRTVRNMVTSRTAYKFASDTEAAFPAGGYGIYVDRTTAGSRSWLIYANKIAGSGYDVGVDEIIGEEKFINNTKIDIFDDADSTGSLKNTFYISFLNENEIDLTNMILDSGSRYKIDVAYLGKRNSSNQIVEMGYYGLLRIAELSDDGSTYINLGRVFSSLTPPLNDDDDGGGGGGKREATY